MTSLLHFEATCITGIFSVQLILIGDFCFYPAVVRCPCFILIFLKTKLLPFWPIYCFSSFVGERQGKCYKLLSFVEQELLASIRYIWIARHWKTIKFLNKSCCVNLYQKTLVIIFLQFFPSSRKNFCQPAFLNIDYSSGCAPTKVQVLQFVPIWAQFVSWKPTLTHRENLLKQWLVLIIIHECPLPGQNRSWGYTNWYSYATTIVAPRTSIELVKSGKL